MVSGISGVEFEASWLVIGFVAGCTIGIAVELVRRFGGVGIEFAGSLPASAAIRHPRVASSSRCVAVITARSREWADETLWRCFMQSDELEKNSGCNAAHADCANGLKGNCDRENGHTGSHHCSSCNMAF